MKRRFVLGGIGAVVAAAVAAITLLVYPGDLMAGGDDNARSVLRNADGVPVGQVKLTQEDDGTVLIRANVHGLPQGFHGFHVHGIGECTPPFTSAGGHLNLGGHSHPGHSADLPVLLVNEDGTGEMRVKTDRFELAQLFDADGSAFIIHALPDNYANIPQRYGVPDEATLSTGDAGGRIACGVIEN